MIIIGYYENKSGKYSINGDQFCHFRKYSMGSFDDEDLNLRLYDNFIYLYNAAPISKEPENTVELIAYNNGELRKYSNIDFDNMSKIFNNPSITIIDAPINIGYIKFSAIVDGSKIEFENYGYSKSDYDFMQQMIMQNNDAIKSKYNITIDAKDNNISVTDTNGADIKFGIYAIWYNEEKDIIKSNDYMSGGKLCWL